MKRWNLPKRLSSVICAALLALGLSAQLRADSIPEGYESYLERPDILNVTAQAHPELGADWEKLKRAHIEAVAQLLEMYPDREIYFLARDSELLYDMARLA